MPDNPFTDLTAEQLVACEGAKRLLADQIFHDTLNAIVGDATQRAILSPEASEREDNRQLILAINRIRGTLERAVDYVEAAKQAKQQEKAFE